MKKAAYAGILSVFCLILFAAPAGAAEEPYEYNPTFSLAGDCSKSSADPTPDPDCPYPPPPGGPTGRFSIPTGSAVDAYGNLYVASYSSGGPKGRIDIFDDEGHFISELPDPHGPKSLAIDKDGNLYVFESNSGENVVVRYEPTVYKPELEEEEIQYVASSRVIVDDTTAASSVAGLAVDSSNGHLFATYWGDFINEYGSATEDNPLLETITHESLKRSAFVAVDAERRRLFSTNCKNEIFDCEVLVFEADAPYELLEVIDGSTTPDGEFLSERAWNAMAVDEETGHFFIDDLGKTHKIFEFGENYEYLSTIDQPFLEGPLYHQISVSNSVLDPTAKNNRFLFVPVPREAGNVFAFQPPNVRPPTLENVQVTNISEREAELQATVDPRGGETEYVFEYVTQESYEESGFAGAKVVEGTVPGGALATKVVAPLSDLSPGTTYRFRVTATNEKGSVEKEGPVFATYDNTISVGSCPNESLRMGPSAALPDCRAYELVTPPDTNGRPPKGLFKGQFPTLQVSPLGNAVSFVSEGGSLPGTEGTGGFQGDRYRTTRGPTGWSTASTGPNGVETNNPAPGSSSPDQGFGFWASGGVGTKLVEGKAAYYVMYPDGHSEFVGRGSLGTDPWAQGRLITDNGSHIVFVTSKALGDAPQLEPGAPPSGTEAVYDRTRDAGTGIETTHVVSLLPGDETPQEGEDASYVGASSDAAGIAFRIAGTLYLRVDNAVTYEIGDGLTFAGVSQGGSRIFYVKAGDLYAFDTEDQEELAFTETGEGVRVVNVAPDGSRAYFVSKEAIPGSGTNPLGDAPQAGQNNLYLSEEGAISFVATVTERDVVGEQGKDSVQMDGLGLWVDVLLSQELARDPSRVDSDGSVLLFQSRADLVGYDSGDFPQIYRYDRTGNRLHCISCIPTKAPASGGASLQSLRLGSLSVQPLAPISFVPLPEDGKRAFFESEEALVSTDNNGARDVYEWEEQGIGGCQRAGGCVFLISSGHSVRDNYLYGASSSGDDVFFVTDDVLVPGDNDTASIYDARVGGGFQQVDAPPCNGEGCRPPLIPAPGLTPPAAPAPPGANDNVKPKKRCGKGKRRAVRKGREVCIKKKQRKRPHRKAGAKRGGAK